jgi:hypothetical protein
MPPENGPLDDAKTVVEVIGSVIKAAGDHPDVKVAGGELAKTAATLTKTLNVMLLPLAAVTFAYDKAREYFSSKFQEELAEASAQIPSESITQPKPSIAGPALQGLAFALDEPDLKRMYLNLLASAMDGRAPDAVHPAFVELIRQLTAEEATLLRHILATPGGVPIAEIRLQEKATGGYRMLQTHVLNLGDVDPVTKTYTIIENPRLAAMVDNWTRLGLARVTYASSFEDKKLYAWVKSRPEMTRHHAHNTSSHIVTYGEGILVSTDLGKQFGRAVGILDTSQPQQAAHAPNAG